MKRKKTAKKRPSRLTLVRAAGGLGACAAALGILLVIPPGGGRAPAPLAVPAVEPALPGIHLPPAAATRRPDTPGSSTGPSYAGRAYTGRSYKDGPCAGGAPIPLAFVVDDAGHNVADAEAYLRFPGKLTLAVLPQLEFSEEVARRGMQAGKEVILHLPMEPQGSSDPGPGAIRVGDAEPAVIGLLEWHFRSVVTRGVNNHMGSRATADPRIMDTIMAYLKRTGRFFLDSRTTADTVAGEAAARHGVPFLSRDVFLDVNVDEATVESAIDRGMDIACVQGSAILIGHVTNRVVLDVLERRLPEIEHAGFELVHLSELLSP